MTSPPFHDRTRRRAAATTLLLWQCTLVAGLASAGTLKVAGMEGHAGPAGTDATMASAGASAPASGEAIYGRSCIACHGADGAGVLPGVPDFTAPGGLLTQPDAVLIERITKGYQSPGSPLAMPPKGGDPSLTAQQIRDVLAYLRKEFGPK